MLFLCCAAGACQSAPRAARPSPVRTIPGDAAPSEQRIYAFANRSLLIPLTSAQPLAAVGAGTDEPGQGGWRPARPPVVTLQSGEALPVEMVYIEATPPAPGPFSWLPPSPEWRVTPWQDTVTPQWNPGPGYWALVAPPLSPRQTVRCNGAAMPLVWLQTPPASTDAARAPRLDLDRAALRALGALLRPEAADPFRAWRIAILTDRIRPVDLWEQPPTPVDSPPALILLREQNELRWRAAIATLEREDPELANELVARLTAVVALPTGVAVPAWPLEGPELFSVRSALLSPTANRQSRREAVANWLDTASQGIAWIIDESGAAPPGMVNVLAGVANLGARAGVGSTAPQGQATRNAARLPAHGAGAFASIVSADPGRPAALVARVEGWSAALPTSAAPTPVSPPGLLLGPLLPQWDMASWMTGRPRAPHPRAACVVMLQRSASSSIEWELYIEATGGGDEDVVSVWLGGYGAPSTVLRVGPGAEGGPVISQSSDRWAAIVPLPAVAIEADEIVRVGISRSSTGGYAWSWPRPLMPGRSEPGRASVTLAGWGSLAPAD